MDHEETRRSLCSYILFVGGRNSNHDREGEGGGKNRTIHRTIMLCRWCGLREDAEAAHL